MPYDLFISYARRDNAPLKGDGVGSDRPGPVSQLVTQIGNDFEQFAGRPLRPFFDTTEIHGMEDWRQRILQGLRESRLLLACLSPSYLASEYCEWEFIEYLNHEVARGFVGEGVAPLYFVEVPGWQDQDFEQRCDEWVADLRRRNHFDLRLWFNEGQEALRHADVQARMGQLKEQIAKRIQRGERAEQSLGNVDAPNAHFIGRGTELRSLRESVALRKVGVLTVVHGLGGMGKTALAVEYAHAFAHEYGGGRWQVQCEGRDNLATAIATLAPVLQIEFTDAEKLDSELHLQRVLAELQNLANAREPHHCLLLLENVDQPKLLEPAQSQRLPAADWLHVIATSRLGEGDLFGRHKDRAFLSVDELPEADAVNLIESFQPGGKFTEDTERAAAGEIVRLLGLFTLAVESAAVYLGQFEGDVTCACFLARLKKDGLKGLESAARQTTEGLRHGEKGLVATLQPTLERLHEPERIALTFGALLPADQIALPWIRTLMAEKFPELGRDSEPGHPDPWLNLLRRLFGMRLWQPTETKDADGEVLVARMHRLLQEVLKTRAGELTETLEQTLLEQVKARAGFLWNGWVRHEHRWELEVLAACAWQWMERGTEAGALLAINVAGPLQRLDNFVESERLTRRALEISEQHYGPDHPQVEAALTGLAAVLSTMNRLAEAEDLMRRALAIREQDFGGDRPGGAAPLNNLAVLLGNTGRLSEAEELFRRALEIEEQTSGPGDPRVAQSLRHLASLLKATNRADEALPLLWRALEIDMQSHGEVHPDVASDLTALGLLQRNMNLLDDAESFLRRALAIDLQIYDAEHHVVAKDLSNLVVVLQATNKLEEAEKLMRWAIAIIDKSLGRDHPEMATALNNLAQLLQATNQMDEAEALLCQALIIDEQSYGPDHPAVGMNLNNMAVLLQATNRLNEAEPLLRRALLIFERIYGPDHPEVALTLNNLLPVLRTRKQFAEAELVTRQALEIFEKTYGPSHPKVALALNNLAQVLRATNRPEAAEPLMRRALAISEKSFGPDHPDVVRDLNNLARLLMASNRMSEAGPLITRAMLVCLGSSKAFGREHQYQRLTQDNLAQWRRQMGLDQPGLLGRLKNLIRKSDV